MKDQSGAVLPGVTVTARNQDTGLTRTAVSGPDGEYRLPALPPGTSQDNIRGFFYRGNVNVGAGTREYSNGFVVDGVNNTWAEMGEPR